MSRLSFEKIASYIAECESYEGRQQKALGFEKALGMSAKNLLAAAEKIRNGEGTTISHGS